MGDKKRLYWNSCSFLYADYMLEKNYILANRNILSKLFKDSNHSYIASSMGSSNESIFRRTLIDCSKNDFEFVVIGWTHPERTSILDITKDLDIEKLKEESELNFLGNGPNKNIHCYIDKIPSKATNPSFLKFEPKGTDDTILYTIALHNFFKQKGIPHLFLNMGKLDSNVLEARKSWLEGIDPKNYLSANNNDTILQKMSFSFTEYYAKKAEKIVVKDSEIRKYKLLKENSDEEYRKTGWVDDIGGHLGRLGYKDLFKIMHDYIIENNLV